MVVFVTQTLGVVATIMLSLAKASLASRSVMSTIFSKQTGFGLGAGAFLGFCTVAYGAAIKHIPTDDVMLNAGLAAATTEARSSVVSKG